MDSEKKNAKENVESEFDNLSDQDGKNIKETQAAPTVPGTTMLTKLGNAVKESLSGPPSTPTQAEKAEAETPVSTTSTSTSKVENPQSGAASSSTSSNLETYSAAELTYEPVNYGSSSVNRTRQANSSGIITAGVSRANQLGLSQRYENLISYGQLMKASALPTYDLNQMKVSLEEHFDKNVGQKTFDDFVSNASKWLNEVMRQESGVIVKNFIVAVLEKGSTFSNDVERNIDLYERAMSQIATFKQKVGLTTQNAKLANEKSFENAFKAINGLLLAYPIGNDFNFDHLYALDLFKRAIEARATDLRTLNPMYHKYYYMAGVVKGVPFDLHAALCNVHLGNTVRLIRYLQEQANDTGARFYNKFKVSPIGRFFWTSPSALAAYNSDSLIAKMETWQSMGLEEMNRVPVEFVFRYLLAVNPWKLMQSYQFRQIRNKRDAESIGEARKLLNNVKGLMGSVIKIAAMLRTLCNTTVTSERVVVGPNDRDFSFRWNRDLERRDTLEKVHATEISLISEGFNWTGRPEEAYSQLYFGALKCVQAFIRSIKTNTFGKRGGANTKVLNARIAKTNEKEYSIPNMLDEHFTQDAENMIEMSWEELEANEGVESKLENVSEKKAKAKPGKPTVQTKEKPLTIGETNAKATNIAKPGTGAPTKEDKEAKVENNIFTVKDLEKLTPAIAAKSFSVNGKLVFIGERGSVIITAINDEDKISIIYRGTEVYSFPRKNLANVLNTTVPWLVQAHIMPFTFYQDGTVSFRVENKKAFVANGKGGFRAAEIEKDYCDLDA